MTSERVEEEGEEVELKMLGIIVIILDNCICTIDGHFTSSLLF